MKNKIVMVMLSVALIVGLILTGCAKPVAPPEGPAEGPTPEEKPQEESITIKLSDFVSADSVWGSTGINPWADYVEYATQGRVKVDRYWDATLHTHKDSYMAVETGITDMCSIWNPSLPGKWPLMDVWHLPGLMNVWAVNNVVMRDIFDMYPCFNEQYSDKVVNIWTCVHMMSNLHTVEPVRNLEELQGKIIASTNEDGARALSALGASTTVMVGSDAYLAAQRGVIDGIFAAWGWVEVLHLHEVTPYHNLLRICPGSTSNLMNRKTWDKFTPSEQMMLKEYRYRGMINFNQGAIYSSMAVRSTIPEEYFIEWSKEDLDKMRALFKPAWDEWVNEVEVLGYPGRDILNDILRLLEGYTFD